MSNATECITCIITDFQLNLLSPAFAYLLSIERDGKYTVYQKKDNPGILLSISFLCEILR